MDIRWLESFVAVADELHFGRAAARMYMAQSALSQTIRKLERELGTALFERSTRSVTLTAAGYGFLAHARTILEEMDTARRAAASSVEGTYGRLSIGFSGVLNHLALPALTRAVRERYPGIALNLVGRIMNAEAVERLESGEFHVAFVGLPVDSSRVETRLIAREPMGVIVPSDHPFAAQSSVLLADLAGADFITTPDVGSSLRDCTLRACADAGFQPRIVQDITDPYMILMLVAAGVGVAMVTEGIAQVAPPGARYLPLEGDPVLMLHALAWSPTRESTVRDTVLALSEEVLPTPMP